MKPEWWNKTRNIRWWRLRNIINICKIKIGKKVKNYNYTQSLSIKSQELGFIYYNTFSLDNFCEHLNSFSNTETILCDVIEIYKFQSPVKIVSSVKSYKRVRDLHCQVGKCVKRCKRIATCNTFQNDNGVGQKSIQLQSTEQMDQHSLFTS